MGYLFVAQNVYSIGLSLSLYNGNIHSTLLKVKGKMHGINYPWKKGEYITSRPGIIDTLWCKMGL